MTCACPGHQCADECLTRLQRAKSVYRFLKQQQDQSHKVKEADQASLMKTVQVFQEQIQQSREELTEVVAENKAMKADRQKVRRNIRKIAAFMRLTCVRPQLVDTRADESRS